jgi:hypothetical protein
MNFAELTTYTVTTTNTTSNNSSMAGLTILYVAILLVAIIAQWKVYTKAGQAGWKVLIPIYNIYILLKIIGRPWWWLLLLLIPIVNIVVSVLIPLELAKVFGKSVVFAIFGLIIFSLIGYLILAFGDAKYVGPSKPATAS